MKLKQPQGPFVEAFNDTKGVTYQELVTYRIKDGMLRKETATRKFYESGDYHDTSNVVPLVEAN